MKKTFHQIFVGTVATVLGTIIALFIWWAVEHRLPEQIPAKPPSTIATL